jgi:arylsulfatase A-like enzyme
VENRFLAPTLLELAGVEAPGNLRAKALLAEPVPVSTELFFNTEIGVTEKPGERSVHAFRSATEHFVWAPPMGEEHPELVRYHELATDPNTQRDVAAEHAERVTDLKHRIVRWWKDGERRRPEVFGAAEGADELLQALGYMGKDE